LNINLKDSNIPEATPVEIPSPSLVPATL
jgi:hypothetical protein